MSSEKKYPYFLLLFLVMGALASAVPLGNGEEVIKSRNCPEGVAVSRLASSREIRIEGVHPDHLSDLFAPVQGYTLYSEETEPGAGKLRKRTVSLRQDQLFRIEGTEDPGKETVSLRDMVRINLFKGLEINAILSRVDQTDYSFTWVGNVEGRADLGTASFTWADGIMLGRVNIYGEGIFNISPKGEGLFEIEEMDTSGIKFAPPIFPDSDLLRESSPGSDISYSSDGVIEIMIVWTLDAAAGASAKGTTIQAEIAQAVSLINTTYANSNVVQRVSLAASAGTSYTSSNDSLTDLTRLQTPDDGYMDEIHLLRQIAKADCVSLITNGFDGSTIGQGYALESYSSSYFRNYAFSVMDRHYFYYQTLTHELGHNMGAGHELDNPSSPGPQYYSYSSAYYIDGDWHTMMSYQHSGSRKIEYFSNPDIYYQGKPLGMPGDSGNDNSRTLDNTMSLVDSFGEELEPDLTSCYQSDHFYFDPHSVISEDELEISIRVCNYGNSPASGFHVDFYASLNNNITENDYFLGRELSSGIQAYSSSSVLWTGDFSQEIPTGEYYIGWIIDSEGEIPESNENNNSGIFPTSRLSVTQVLQCDYSISPTIRAYSASGGSSSINVTARTGCPWNAVSQEEWITIDYGASGTGNGSIIYSVMPNASYFQRTGKIRVEDQFFTVIQDGALPDCTVTLLPKNRTHSPEGGSGTISVSSPPGCSWSAASQAGWISISSGQSGTGDGIIQYSVEENGTEDERSGQINVEEASFSVIQESSFTALERQDMLVFPANFRHFSPLLGNTFVGATALNLNQEEKPVIFFGLDSDGNRIAINSGLPDLEPLGQMAKMTSELINLTPELSTITVEGDGEHIPIRGIFVLGDDLTKRLDGIGQRWVPSTELYMLQGEKKAGKITTVYIYNTSSSSTSDLLLEWKDSEGRTIDSRIRSIQPGGTLFHSLSDLFSLNPDYEEGYLKVTSSTEICGFTLSGTDQSFVAFPAQVPKESAALYAPHFLLFPDGTGTEIQLINVGLVPASVVFQSFQDSGTEFETQGIELQPGAMLKGSITEFLPLDPGSLSPGQILTGNLKISISTTGEYESFESPKVLGGVTLSGSARSETGMPLEKTGWKKIVFPHVAQSLDMRIFTGLVVWNINNQAAQITVRAWNRDGEPSGEKEFSLDPNQRRIGLLHESFYFGPGFSQVGGHLEISSDQPVIAYCLYGDYEMEYLSTIGGQELAGD